MRLPPCTVTVALALLAGPAAGGDALHTPACLRALDALGAAESAGTDAARGGDDAEPLARRAYVARLDRLRVLAAQACLGARDEGDALPGARRERPPVEAKPVAPAVAPRRLPAPMRPVPPAVRPAPSQLITSCDPSGCWTSDGTRVQRMGPLLVAPQGVCMAQGPLLTCPPGAR